MERIDEGQDFAAYVDYAHTPDAVRTLLASVRPFTGGRVLLVLGCGGDRDPFKRPLMGAAAVRGADEVFFTDDNPRTEASADILAAIADGAEQVAGEGGRWQVVPDRARAIAAAVAAARAGDTLVVAGKGHEQGQEVGDAVRPFDDRLALRAALTGTADRAGAVPSRPAGLL
jgi:UDP-N-acetylmuramoyl-L-alanyl-D-glutamate--2,6-diaminopimelate ligase